MAATLERHNHNSTPSTRVSRSHYQTAKIPTRVTRAPRCSIFALTFKSSAQLP